MPGGKGSDSSGVSDDSDIDSHTNAKATREGQLQGFLRLLEGGASKDAKK